MAFARALAIFNRFFSFRPLAAMVYPRVVQLGRLSQEAVISLSLFIPKIPSKRLFAYNSTIASMKGAASEYAALKKDHLIKKNDGKLRLKLFPEEMRFSASCADELVDDLRRIGQEMQSRIDSIVQLVQNRSIQGSISDGTVILSLCDELGSVKGNLIKEEQSEADEPPNMIFPILSVAEILPLSHSSLSDLELLPSFNPWIE